MTAENTDNDIVVCKIITSLLSSVEAIEAVAHEVVKELAEHHGSSN